MSLNIRKIRGLLWIVAAMFVSGAIGGLIFACQPITYVVPAPESSSAAATSSSQASESQALLQNLQQLAHMNLRRALHDPSPISSPQPTPAIPPPPLDIRLAGTICEPGHSQAMIQLSDGTLEFKSVGDSVASARILDIEEGQITVEYLGKPLVLSVPQPEGG